MCSWFTCTRYGPSIANCGTAMHRHHCSSMAFIYIGIAALLLLPFGASFSPPMHSVVSRAFNKLEGFIASRKVNANVDNKTDKYATGPDSEYDYAATQPKFDHSLWSEVLKKHVSGGEVEGITTNVVDYRAIAEDGNFDQYQKALAGANLAELATKPNELLALYINAYNALCISHVTRFIKENDGELPTSVTKTTPSDQKGKEIWDCPVGVVGGEKVTLNDIENVILRSRWSEPRIHASINCASASCPNLRTEAFVPHKLNSQMDDQTKTWIADTTKGLKIEKEELYLSRIFLWFGGDFDVRGGPLAFVTQHASNEVSSSSLEDKKVDYFPYCWYLNTK